MSAELVSGFVEGDLKLASLLRRWLPGVNLWKCDLKIKLASILRKWFVKC